MLGLPRTIFRTAVKTGSGAVHLGAWGLGKATSRLRGDGDGGEVREVEVEHRGGATVVEPTRPARPAPRRISNPKAAKAVRKRQAKAETITKLEVPGDTGHGGHPITQHAENTPRERAQAKAGKEPAPMGSSRGDQPKTAS